MAHARGDEGAGLLQTLARELSPDADSFTPQRETDEPRSLPGRQPGRHDRQASRAPTGAAAVVLDCGTSRRAGFTHVLWISPSLESLLGSSRAERVGPAIGALPQVAAWTWEGADRLHVRAPGEDWDALLAAARDAVTALARS